MDRSDIAGLKREKHSKEEDGAVVGHLQALGN